MTRWAVSLIDRTTSVGSSYASREALGSFTADRVRVVECDGRGGPTRSAVARLLPDGTVDRGHALRHGQVAAPVVLADVTIVVLDGGALVAVDRDLRGTVLDEALDEGDEFWRFSATLTSRGDVLAVMVVERTREVPIAYSTHRIVYKLRS